MYRAQRKLLGCLQSVRRFVIYHPSKLIPTEIWFMGYIIYLRMGTSPTVALARQIGKLRMDTRAKFRDVFSNGTTVAFMYKWLDKLPVEKPGPNQQVAAQEWAGEDIPGSTSTGLARKRKADQQDAADTDYRDSAPTSRNGSRSTAPVPKTRKTTESTTTRSTVNRPAAPPPPPSERPPPSAMDAAPGPYPQVYGGVNPYPMSNPNPYDQRAQQVSAPYVRGKHADNLAIKQ